MNQSTASEILTDPLPIDRTGVQEESSEVKFGRRKTDTVDLSTYHHICKDRFVSIEKAIKEELELLMDIHSKVNNGYDKDIKNLYESIDSVKEVADAKIQDLKKENEQEHLELKNGQDSITKSMRNLIITIIVSAVTVGGGILATILTGFFGLLEKVSQMGGTP